MTQRDCVHLGGRIAHLLFQLCMYVCRHASVFNSPHGIGRPQLTPDQSTCSSQAPESWNPRAGCYCVIQPKATEFRKNKHQPTGRGALGLVLHHDLIENLSRYWGSTGALTTTPRKIKSGRFPLLTTFVREDGLASPGRSKGRRMRHLFPHESTSVPGLQRGLH